MKMGFIITLLATSVAAQTPSIWRVHLSVSISEKSLNDDVTSSLTRELRSLGDVTLVAEKENPEFTISVVGLSLESVGKAKTGFAMSIVVRRPMNPLLLETLLKEKVKAADFSELSDYLIRFSEIESSDLYTGPPDSLRSNCEEVIVQFDRTILQPARESFAQYLKNVKKQEY